MKHRQSAVVGGAILSSLLLLSLRAPVLPAAQIVRGEAERNFVMTVKDNLISLKAKDPSLKEVLEEIGRRMKIDVVANVPDNQKITAEFEKLSIEETVKRISTSYSLLTDSTKGEGKVSKIIVLQKGKETALSRPTTQESAVKKEERSVKPETRVREEVTRKESPSPESFKFEFDPPKWREKSVGS